MSDPRVIKKYPNRRLYDTVESRYITLADIRKLVIDRIDFIVIDKKTQGDITRSILLQVIAEQEHSTEPVMSRDFLSQIIRSYGGATARHDRQLSRAEPEVVCRAAARGARARQGGVRGGSEPMAAAGLAHRNYQRWRSVQDRDLPHADECRGQCSRAGNAGCDEAHRQPATNCAALLSLQRADQPILRQVTLRRRCAWRAARGPGGRPRAPSRAPRRLPSACRSRARRALRKSARCARGRRGPAGS